MFKVHENSRQPDYLAIVIIYVSGRNDITAVQLWQAVFDTASPPRGGDISVRFQVGGGSGVRWIQPKNAIPGDWKAGATYSIGIQLD
ncbi:hypothetical protein SAY87_020526 [Trapa incisa]|uniref:Expansin-like CBD domain-containing protein n=1 Tax=Trapa incisa TaxID=236973 RepID=A0AAN7PPN1_9MYRT|nr:hypothetical protein SAY87_020526 [Trapa incisa]